MFFRSSSHACAHTLSRLFAGSLVATLVAVQLTAQEHERVPIPDPTPRATRDAPIAPVAPITSILPDGPIVDTPERRPALIPEGATMPPPPISVRPEEITPPGTDLGDEPDYCRMTDVLDENGNIVAIRRVGNPYVLSFTNGDYAPEPGIDPELRRTLLARPGGHTFGFIMFKGRMSEEKLDQVRATGVTLINLMTYQSMQAKIPSSALAALERMPFVHWVGYARENQKLDHNFAPVIAAAKDGDLLPVIINPFESDMGGDSVLRIVGKKVVHNEWNTVDVEGAPSTLVIPNGRLHRLLTEEFGFEFKHYNEVIHSFEGRMTKAKVLELLGEDWVHSVELDPGPIVLFHDQVMPMAGQDWVRGSFGGQGVACGFADSGIDSTPWHNDFGGKYYVYFNNAITPLDDHGTHVAGTIWGNGSANGRYKGAAPTVATGGATNRVFFHRTDASLSTMVSDFGKNFTDSNNLTSPFPRVVSNSWGWLASGGYSGTEAEARTMDKACYDSRQLWVFASGNTKSTANMWCASPGSGKNVLTVGSIVDTFNSSRTLNPEQKSGFSRWAVTDARTKPELVACGETLTSTQWNSTNLYSNKNGTSMSTPTVSGVLVSKIDSSSWFNDKPEALRALAVASCENEGLLSGGDTAEPQTGSGVRQTTGWGMINSPGMVWALTETTHNTVSLTFTASGQGWNSSSIGDISVPSDAQFVRVVLAITEPTVSSTAAQARRNDVRGYLDWSPFTSGDNTGEIAVASGLQTVIVYNWASVPAASLGGKVRLKAYAQSIVASQARVGLVVFWYKRHPSTNPYVTATGDSVVRPNSSYVLTGAMRSYTTGDQFRNGRLWYDGAFAINSLTRTTQDSYAQWYYSSNAHDSSPFPSVGKGAGTGIVVGSGTYRPVNFNLTSPAAEGNYILYVRGTYATPTSPAPQIEATRSVCVDGSAPNVLSNLKSTTHTPGAWSNQTTMIHTWSTATDVGCAGVMNLPYVVSEGAASTPTSSSATKTATTTSDSRSVGNTSSGHYFNIRVRDNVDYFSSTQSLGPYKIDTTNPVVTSVSINTGAAKTGSLTVSIQAAGTDTYSGIQTMEYSGNGTSWTSPYSYTSGSRSFDLSTLPGGNANEGTKYVYVRFRDAAGNYSSAGSDTIVYVAPPVITGASVSSLEAVNYGFYSLTGTGFTETESVRFGASTISSKYDAGDHSWWPTGAFLVISDTVLYVYPPQGQTPGTYGILSYNGTSWSNSRNVEVTANKTPILRTSSILPATAVQTIMVTRGNLKSTVVRQVILVSVFKVPSKFLPIYNFEIGNNFAQLEMFPQWPFDANGVSKLSYKTLASFKGVTAHFEAAYLDFTSPIWPMPSSDVWTTSFK